MKKRPVNPLNIASKLSDASEVLYRNASKATRRLASQASAELRQQRRVEWAKQNLNLPSR